MQLRLRQQRHRVRRNCPVCNAIIEFETLGSATSNSDESTVADPLPASDSVPKLGRCGACAAEVAIKATDTLNRNPPTPVGDKTSPLTTDLIVADAYAAIRRQSTLLISASALTWLMWLALVAIPGKWLWDLWQRMDSGGADQLIVGMGPLLAATAMYSFVALATTAYTHLIMGRVALCIARHHVPPNRFDALDLSCSLRVWWRLVCVWMMIKFVLTVTLLCGVALLVLTSLFIDSQRAIIVGTFASGVLFLLVAGMLQWWLWPAMLLIVDQRADLVHSLSWARVMSMRHARLSLSMVVAYTVITTIGSLLLVIGQILATPLAVMPLACAYIRLTGGQIGGPGEPTLQRP
ncbi:MAG: hypothetical protein AAF539_02135 [Planctomycetota bacterium]